MTRDHPLTLAAALAALLSVSACAGDGVANGDRGGLFDRLAGRGHIQGDADGATITGMASAADGWPLAVGHCSHFHRSAQYAGRSGDGFRYRCVSG